MLRHGIPTAASGQFSSAEEAREVCGRHENANRGESQRARTGQGRDHRETHAEADAAIREIMEERKFGDAGAEVVIEEFLEGLECSIHALVDGKNYLLFPSAQDHKRALDGDAGLNTGGMGTFSPADKVLPPELEQRMRVEVLDRFLAGLRADGIDFRGMLFPGLMITSDGLKVLEFNCRFGDPETQVLLTLSRQRPARSPGGHDRSAPGQSFRPMESRCGRVRGDGERRLPGILREREAD